MVRNEVGLAGQGYRRGVEAKWWVDVIRSDVVETGLFGRARGQGDLDQGQVDVGLVAEGQAILPSILQARRGGVEERLDGQLGGNVLLPEAVYQLVMFGEAFVGRVATALGQQALIERRAGQIVLAIAYVEGTDFRVVTPCWVYNDVHWAALVMPCSSQETLVGLLPYWPRWLPTRPSVQPSMG